MLLLTACSLFDHYLYSWLVLTDFMGNFSGGLALLEQAGPLVHTREEALDLAQVRCSMLSARCSACACACTVCWLALLPHAVSVCDVAPVPQMLVMTRAQVHAMRELRN